MRLALFAFGNRLLLSLFAVSLLLGSSASFAAEPIVRGRPAHAPGSVPPSPRSHHFSSHVQNSEPTPADLEFGEQQLRKLLEDRPAMRGYAVPGDPIWIRAVRGLAGDTCGYRVSWNTEDLDKPLIYPSDHAFPHPPDFKAFIRIRAAGPNGPYNGEYLWSCLFFELFNLANHHGFNAIYDKSLTGTVSRQEWLTENTKLEFLAMKKMIVFYRGTWVPEMTARRIPTDPSYWKNGEKETYEEWISQYVDEDYYPYDYWGKYYDNSIVPYLEQLKEWKKHNR